MRQKRFQADNYTLKAQLNSIVKGEKNPKTGNLHTRETLSRYLRRDKAFLGAPSRRRLPDAPIKYDF